MRILKSSAICASTFALLFSMAFFFRTDVEARLLSLDSLYMLIFSWVLGFTISICLMFSLVIAFDNFSKTVSITLFTIPGILFGVLYAYVALNFIGARSGAPLLQTISSNGLALWVLGYASIGLFSGLSGWYYLIKLEQNNA